MSQVPATPLQTVDRLVRATNEHDLEGIVACFAEDYRNETPAHPARGFVGRDRVRLNWQAILASVPDVEVEVVAAAAAGARVWSEWEHRGTRPDGTIHRLRGVIVFEIEDDLIAGARFFLEPVHDDGNVATAITRQVER